MQTFLYWFAKSLIVFMQALPLDLVASIGRAGGAIAHVIDKRHRRVVLANLRRCFPGMSQQEIDAICRENFRRLGENYLSSVKTAGMKFEDVLAVCEIVGLEHLASKEDAAFIGPRHESVADANRIVAIGHFGNFELYAMLSRCLPGYRGASTYRGLNQPGLNRLLEELRDRSGCMFFERRTGLRALTRALSGKGILIGLLSDQHGGPKGVWAPFMGVECSTNPAAAVFALRYESALNTAICFRVGLARWRLEIGEEIPTHENGTPRTVEAIMSDVNAKFEAAIRRDPANWFWVHKRWKPRPVSTTPALAD